MPQTYTIPEFTSQFFGPDSPRSLRDTFQDLFFYGEQSFTWEAGVLNFCNALEEAEVEQPDSPDPDNPFLLAESPNSVLDLQGQVGSPQILQPVVESPLDPFCINPQITLALGLGLVLLVLRKVWKSSKRVREKPSVD